MVPSDAAAKAWPVATVDLSLSGAMSTQLSTMWVLAMCAMAVMMVVSVTWKLNEEGRLVNAESGAPYVHQRHRVAPSDSKFGVIKRMMGFIKLCYGTDPDVFDPEHQPKLNSKSPDVAVHSMARVTTYVNTEIDDHDYISELVEACKKVGQGCYVKFSVSSTRAKDLPHLNTENEERWFCLYKEVLLARSL